MSCSSTPSSSRGRCRPALCELHHILREEHTILLGEATLLGDVGSGLKEGAMRVELDQAAEC
jgi:hypothetical protein